MTSFTSTDALKKHLLETEVSKPQTLSLYDIEDLCAPLIAEIGLEKSIQDKLNEYVLLEDGYCIDVVSVLKMLEVVASSEYSSKTKGLLVSANVLPDDPNTNDDANDDVNVIDAGNTGKAIEAEGDASTQKETLVFQNSKCEIYHCDEIKSGKIKYMITKRSLCKVLQRAYSDDDRFSEYFSLKLELSVIYSQYQSEHKAHHIEATHDLFRNEVLAAMQALGNKIDSQTTELQTTNGKLDLTNAQLKSERLTNKQILTRVSSMATEFHKLKSYASQKSRKSTKDPLNEDLCHGFAITTKQVRDRSTNASKHHFGIIAGQRHYVEKTVEAKLNEGRQVLIDFTYIANPIDYRNNVVTRVKQRLDEAVERANAEFSNVKIEANNAIQDRINVLELESYEADRQYSYHLRAWKNPESIMRELNAQISTRNQVRQDRLKQDVAAHNAQQKLLPREERAASRNWQREWPDLREAKLVRDEEVHAALSLVQEPSLVDYISAQRLSDLTQEIARLKMEREQPARQICAQDIPVEVTTLACVWKENKWFPRDELLAIFHKVLSETQSMSADVDESIFDGIETMDAEGDDLTSMLAPDDDILDNKTP